MRTLLFSFVCLLLIGCQNYDKGHTEFLTEKDGVRLYRCYDGIRWVYFTSLSSDVKWEEKQSYRAGKATGVKRIDLETLGK